MIEPRMPEMGKKPNSAGVGPSGKGAGPAGAGVGPSGKGARPDGVGVWPSGVGIVSGGAGGSPGASMAKRRSGLFAAGVTALALSFSLTALPTDLAPMTVAESAYAAQQVKAGTVSSSSAKAAVKAASSETFVTNASGSYKFTSAYSSKCIDVPDAATGNNVAVKTYTSNGTLAQRFVVTQVSSGVYAIQVGCSGKYLVDNGGPSGSRTS